MIELCLLGTGGMMPLVNRFLTSLLVKSNGFGLLIDCGEATQIAIKKAKLSTNSIDYILFTHYHADHISGIMGLLLSMGNSDRVEPVTLIGPKGLNDVIKSLRIIAPELPFQLKLVEIDDNYGEIELKPFTVQYFKLKHKLTCMGYNILLNRLPEFLPEKAKTNNVPLMFWNRLQHGVECVDTKTNITYTPDMVMGEQRKGLKVTYLTDTRPCENIINYCTDADLFICEGMYGNSDKIENAKKYLHMTMLEASEVATKTKPKEMWLTHYSPSENNPKIYEKDLQQIYPNIHIVKDGEKKVLNFE